MVSIIPSIPMFAGITTFLVMFAVGDNFSSSAAFSVLACYNIMRFMMSLGPMGLKVSVHDSCSCSFFPIIALAGFLFPTIVLCLGPLSIPSYTNTTQLHLC
jgi:hypothetical protein